MTWVQMCILAVVQGITEFLPISSDGHLVLASALLFAPGAQPEQMHDVTIVLHLGTLASILCFYRRAILRLLGEDRRVLGLLLVGTIPAVLLGLPVKKLCPQILESFLLAGFMLPVSGLALLWTLRAPPHAERTYQNLSWGQTLWIGLCQATAILPGLSRSGTTISAGLMCGLTRGSAGTFSFLLAIPAISGAGVLASLDILSGESALQTPVWLLGLGALVSFVVGLGAIAWLQRWLDQGRLHYFAWYCIALGLAILAWHGWQALAG